MKKLLFIFLAIMMLSVTMVSAKVYVSTTTVESDYDGVMGVVRFHNTNGEDLNNVKVSMVIPELGEYYYKTIGEVKEDDYSSTLMFGQTEDVQGEYLARIVVYDEDGERRVKHRYVFFD